MNRLLVALDASVGVDPAEFVEAWAADEEASRSGSASVVPAGGGTFLPSGLELVAIPLAVNLASGVVYDLLRRLVSRSRPKVAEELELTEVSSASGDRLVVVRVRRRVR